MRRMVKWWILSIAVSITAVGMYKIINNYYEEKYSDDEISIEISADQLVDAYVTNELLANESFMDKTIKITGTISSITGDNTLTTINLGGSIYSLNCNFNDANEIAKLASYSHGDSIVVIGEVRGVYLTYVTVSECRVE